MTPTLVYDDDCGFCTWAAEYLAARGDLELAGFRDLTDEQRARLPGSWRNCAHLLTDDAVYSCGEAMDEAFRRTDLPGARTVPWARKLPGYGPVRDRTYSFVANHRDWFGKLRRRDPPARS